MLAILEDKLFPHLMSTSCIGPNLAKCGSASVSFGQHRPKVGKQIGGRTRGTCSEAAPGSSFGRGSVGGLAPAVVYSGRRRDHTWPARGPHRSEVCPSWALMAWSLRGVVLCDAVRCGGGFGARRARALACARPLRVPPLWAAPRQWASAAASLPGPACVALGVYGCRWSTPSGVVALARVLALGWAAPGGAGRARLWPPGVAGALRPPPGRALCARHGVCCRVGNTALRAHRALSPRSALGHSVWGICRRCRGGSALAPPPGCLAVSCARSGRRRGRAFLGVLCLQPCQAELRGGSCYGLRAGVRVRHTEMFRQ